MYIFTCLYVYVLIEDEFIASAIKVVVIICFNLNAQRFIHFSLDKQNVFYDILYGLDWGRYIQLIRWSKLRNWSLIVWWDDKQ